MALVKKTISIDTVLDAKLLVNICNSVDFDIDIVSGKYVVDAKSIMGLFSLDLSKPVIIQAECAEDDPFFDEIKEFIIG